VSEDLLRKFSLSKLLFDFVLSDKVAFIVQSADNVFVALESEVSLLAFGGNEFDGHRTVGVLHGSDGVALSVLLVVGIARSERVGAGPEFNGVEHKAVHQEQADAVHREIHEEEVDNGVEPLVAKRSVPLVKLVEASVRAVATGKHNYTGAEESADTFFHFFCSLRVVFECPKI
jgi:hypothetical protein